MDQSIRLRRPEDDIADQIELIRVMGDLCKNVRQMYTRLALPAAAADEQEHAGSSVIEVGHGDR